MLSKKEEQKILNAIGKNIRTLRTERGLSQFQLHVDAEISKNQIGRLERGERNVKITTLYKIAKALQVDISEILSSK
ncbi:DNA-binding XRE family transcriptional regulator [Jejuia pallidilutea]|uniref:DNA-binding XRE family transcriptional regulator n=1 Tax=Jejuia pallidilutea TaxID=504487 RepID=A0A362X2X8_9FLAO|nr:helix-turn-helix transcriptional regulator [Jejuia pallidilutea]PQV51218.1 DNA-binding XRE family transcriptional regulator [Jejuia pallidilutea]